MNGLLPLVILIFAFGCTTSTQNPSANESQRPLVDEYMALAIGTNYAVKMGWKTDEGPLSMRFNRKTGLWEMMFDNPGQGRNTVFYNDKNGDVHHKPAR